MANDDDPRPQRRRSDVGLIAWFEQTFTKAGKIATAFIAIVGAFSLGGAAYYHFDGRFVHADAYAEDRRADTKRLNQTDLEVVETNRTLVQAQIFTLERQGRLTDAEWKFLQDLKDRYTRLEQKRRLLQQKIDTGSP